MVGPFRFIFLSSLSSEQQNLYESFKQPRAAEHCRRRPKPVCHEALVGDSSKFFCVWPERGRHTACAHLPITTFFFPGVGPRVTRRLARERCAA
jgi:hypothetical protein